MRDKPPFGTKVFATLCWQTEGIRVGVVINPVEEQKKTGEYFAPIREEEICVMFDPPITYEGNTDTYLYLEDDDWQPTIRDASIIAHREALAVRNKIRMDAAEAERILDQRLHHISNSVGELSK